MARGNTKKEIKINVALDTKSAEKDLTGLQRKFENIVSKSGAAKIAGSIFDKRTAVARPGSGIIGRMKEATTIKMSDIKDFDIPELGTTSHKLVRNLNKITAPLSKIDGNKIEKFTTEGFNKLFESMDSRQRQVFSIIASRYGIIS